MSLPLLSELLRRRRPASGSRWSKWALDLAGAHALVDAAWPGAAMTLFARARPPRSLDVRRVVDGRLALRLRVLVEGSRREWTGVQPARSGAAPPAEPPSVQRVVAGAAVAAPASPRPRETALTVQRTAGPAAHTATAEPRIAGVAAQAGRLTVRRVVEQRRRVEHVARSIPAAAEAATGIDPVTGWPLPVDSPRAPAILRTRGGGAREGAPATSRSEPRAVRRSEPAAPAPPLDIDRLADQVVRQIDRRIVAHRERVGRI